MKIKGGGGVLLKLISGETTVINQKISLPYEQIVKNNESLDNVVKGT